MGLPLRRPVAKLSYEAATEENAKRRSFMPRTQVTGKANFSPGITSGLPVIRSQSAASVSGASNFPQRALPVQTDLGQYERPFLLIAHNLKLLHSLASHHLGDKDVALGIHRQRVGMVKFT